MSSPDELPPGFILLHDGPVSLFVAAKWKDAVTELGLLAPGRITRARSGGGSSGRGETELLPLPGTAARLLLRPVLHGGVLGPLLGGAHLGAARALRELATTETLRRAGAPVPEPILVLCERRGCCCSLAVGTRFEEDTRDLLEWLADTPEPAELNRVASAAGKSVRRFHDAGGMHADLHLKNLLFRKTNSDASPDSLEVLVIDLDRARIASEVSPERRATELTRLYRSALKRGYAKQVEGAPIQHFLDAYLANDRALESSLHTALRRNQKELFLRKLGYRLRGWGNK